jgi:hypothetical protein
MNRVCLFFHLFVFIGKIFYPQILLFTDLFSWRSLCLYFPRAKPQKKANEKNVIANGAKRSEANLFVSSIIYGEVLTVECAERSRSIGIYIPYLPEKNKKFAKIRGVKNSLPGIIFFK